MKAKLLHMLPLIQCHLLKVVGLSVVYLFVGISCSSTGEKSDKRQPASQFLAKYGGAPFLGTVRSKATFPNGKNSKTFQGVGSFHVLKGKGGQVKLVLYSKLETKDSLSLMLEGQSTDTDWVMSEGTQQTKIKGQLFNGKLNVDELVVTLKGNIFERLLLLEIKQKFLKKSGNLPAGTIITHDFNLKRGKGKSGNIADCNLVVWKWVTMWTPGGLQTIQVPQCIN